MFNIKSDISNLEEKFT